MYHYPELCCYFAERETERSNKTTKIYVELKRKLSCYNYTNGTENTQTLNVSYITRSKIVSLYF